MLVDYAGAHAQGAKTIGVFVDETADIICQRRAAAGLDFVQLHGDPSRQTLPDLPSDTKVIFVLGATPDGVIRTVLPSQVSGDSARRVCANFLVRVVCSTSPGPFNGTRIMNGCILSFCGSQSMDRRSLCTEVEYEWQNVYVQPEYLLVDSMKGGSGVALDWEALQV